MVKSIIFDSVINTETVGELIQAVEPIVLEGDLVQLYFSSCGGDGPAEQTLSDFLAEWSGSIILIAVFNLLSAGFGIFYDYPGEKRLLPHTVGLIHLSSGDYPSRELQNPKHLVAVLHQENKEANRLMCQQYKLFLTPKEYKQLVQGQDVVLSYKRMLSIFN